MSASSSTAASSLTRSKTTLVFLTALAVVYATYYIHTISNSEDRTTASIPPNSSSSSPGVHRRNAVRRRRTNEEGANEVDINTASAHAETEVDGEAIVRPLGDGETVVDEEEEYHWEEQTVHQRNGSNILTLLYRVSEDGARRNAYVHRGCQCNSCGMVPIRGIKYSCANCADYDLCEACEALGEHTKTHIFYKIRVPTSSFAPQQVQPAWYPGDARLSISSLPREVLVRLARETGYERAELEAYWEQFTFMANTEWREDPDEIGLAMDRKTFDRCLIPTAGNRQRAPNLIHDRMFAFYDTNNDDLISFPEFVNALAFRKKNNKLKRVFDSYDINEDGFLDRKDFLRMFRAYYVLYKNVHRDALAVLEDQVINSTETHQLLASRQPLSSAFGRDGRFPHASSPRTGEGKSRGIFVNTGDLKIIDGKGVIRDSSQDLRSKQDALIELAENDYMRRLEYVETWRPTSGTQYWRAVTAPPKTFEELQREIEEGFHPERSQAQSRVLEREDRDWPPSFLLASDVEAVCGPGWSISDVRPAERLEIVERALIRLRELGVHDDDLAVTEELHERWKRRQFYTDEEEGASAPRGWKEEEDPPKSNGKADEHLKDHGSKQPTFSPQSRSSSKVRFAEDTEDYETRSNPSTSSRSVPERWGGMEIPDAEKDAGKEVLYQVTQQAFNELLDPIFKSLEDNAIAVLSSMETRNANRHLFTNPVFELWAREIDKTLGKPDAVEVEVSEVPSYVAKEIRAMWDAPTITQVELEDVRHQPLHVLLATSGYEVDSHTVQDNTTESQSAVTPGHDDHQETEINTHAEDIQSSEQPPPQGHGNMTDREIAWLVQSRNLNEQQTRLLRMFYTNARARLEGREDAAADDILPNLGPTPILSSPASPASDTLTRSSESIEVPDPSRQDRDSLQETSEVPVVPQAEFSLGREPDEASELNRLAPGQTVVERHSGERSSSVAPPQPRLPLRRNLRSNSLPGAFEPSFTDNIPSRPARPALSSTNVNDIHQEFAGRRQLSGKTRRDLNKRLTSMKEEILAGCSGPQQDADVINGLKQWDWMTLYTLREMDLSAKEAEKRGGWARINYEEFENYSKDMGVYLESMRRRTAVDYLGSWIDFCIP